MASLQSPRTKIVLACLLAKSKMFQVNTYISCFLFYLGYIKTNTNETKLPRACITIKIKFQSRNRKKLLRVYLYMKLNT